MQTHMKNHIKQVARDLHKTEFQHLRLSQCLDEAVKFLGLAQSWQQFIQKPEKVKPIFLMDIRLHPEALTYRYQFDGSWRLVSPSDAFVLGDYFTTDHNQFLKQQKHIEKQDVSLDGKTRSFYQERIISRPMDPTSSIVSTVIHCMPPLSLPSFEQMRAQFANANDECINTLLLDVYGQYSIKKLNDIDINYLHNIVYRGEAWSAKGYVGKKASEDMKYMSDEYSDTLTAWLEFMTSGKTDHLCLEPSKKTLKGLEIDYKTISLNAFRRF